MENARRLRELLRRPGVAVAVGAHDALSAKLIERAGFDAIWASGFAISASLKCIPDASFITSSEQLEIERNIAEAVAGADAVLIHSKSKMFDELRAVAASWTGRVPLVVVPTIFDQTTAADMEAAGFKIIIY